jgi:hypothetical protein
MESSSNFEIAHTSLKPGRDAVAIPLAISRALADRQVGLTRRMARHCDWIDSFDLYIPRGNY